MLLQGNSKGHAAPPLSLYMRGLHWPDLEDAFEPSCLRLSTRKSSLEELKTHMLAVLSISQGTSCGLLQAREEGDSVQPISSSLCRHNASVCEGRFNLNPFRQCDQYFVGGGGGGVPAPPGLKALIIFQAK